MKKIYINPGHSDADAGAVGYETERRLNVAVSAHMKEFLLENYLCETRMNPGSMDSLAAICKDANDWDADLFVSVHFNAGGGDGYEALVYGENRVALGQIFAKHVEEIGQNLRLYGAAPGVKIRPDLAVLKNTYMPAVVNEGAFVDNWKDIQNWNDDAELRILGVAYAEAAAEFLGLERKPVQQEEILEGYSLEQFIRDVQSVTGSAVDGIAGKETLGNTVTISAYQNIRHPVVEYVQKRLFALGYAQVGEADGVAGGKFTQAVKAFQKDNHCVADGEITAKNKTWRKLLGIE